MSLYGTDYPEVVDPGPEDNPTITANSLADEPDAAGWHRGQARFAYLLAKYYSDQLMYVHGVGWMAWEDTRWVEDIGQAKRAVLRLLREGWKKAFKDKEMEQDVRRCESAAGISGVLDIASALEAFSVTVADLDADAYLVNVVNGTLDLRTMSLRPHDPYDRLTKVCRAAYRPGVDSLAWHRFLSTVLPDEEVRGFMQRLAGVALLGMVVEHVFPIATGTGANGKSTAVNAILWALGDYGHVAEPDLFMVAKANPNAATPAKFALRGVRLVVVSETERDQRLAEALMKTLTGGDAITARPLYGKPVTFDPSHTPLMVTNHLPKVAGDDPATWRRLRVVPFDVVVPESERDPKLGQRLQLDADAVLAWAIEGYRQYEQMGLAAPDAVKVATEHYQRDSDAVARFIESECLVGALHTVPVADLWERWQRWRSEEGADELSKKTFGDALDSRGFATSKGAKGIRIRRGITLQGDDQEPRNGW